LGGAQQAILTKIFGGFPQSLQANAGIKPQSDHSHFLAHSFQFSLLPLYSLDTDGIVKQHMKEKIFSIKELHYLTMLNLTEH
jgi:hypothetical protein